MGGGKSKKPVVTFKNWKRGTDYGDRKKKGGE